MRILRHEIPIHDSFKDFFSHELPMANLMKSRADADTVRVISRRQESAADFQGKYGWSPADSGQNTGSYTKWCGDCLKSRGKDAEKEEDGLCLPELRI